VHNTAKVKPGSTVAVFGLGGIGLAVIQGAVHGEGRRGSSDRHQPGQVRAGAAMGATDCVNPKDHDKPIQEVIVDMTDGGVDFSFECIGNVEVMRAALECCHKGWGESRSSASPAPARRSARGRSSWSPAGSGAAARSAACKGRTQLPGMVEQAMRGEIDLDPYITHTNCRWNGSTRPST
jgi:S-(hydroxymethyl)glutathione dehydrogenase / alcohol dehydrogenase